ncbi:hypothetical protein BP00DRAFT_363051 [Aspergillus indologenus CBS 114.80]|uniref:Uncharacterized protein n=1 Tax=Aspergillus indologenus CBS 114.80 TaxID=1450541 RepID=A0A2V5IF01_9EURO|nr:hypothetical protein BP00DRAFT_363051 [Aspergillus indologenus CBS 114.80]
METKHGNKVLSTSTKQSECLEPTPRALDESLHEARLYWHTLAHTALQNLEGGIAPQALAIRDLLKQIPAIPYNDVHDPQAALATFSSNGRLYLRARATWEVADGGDCGVSGKRKARAASIPIGVQRPTPLRFGNDAFSVDEHDIDKPGVQRNVITVLVLAWLYIFSAELVERMQGGSTLVYTDSQADVTSVDDTYNAIDVGDVDQDAARWWAAILAPGPGWRATIMQTGSDRFLSPWSTTGDGHPPAAFPKVRVGKPRGACSSIVPPSARQALGYLVDFCRHHGVSGQLFAALATAITLPTHNCYGVAAILPDIHAQSHIRVPYAQTPNADELYEDISYYMALSSNFHVLISSIGGVFWEPSVPCNKVSPWLHPVLHELLAALDCTSSPGYIEVLATMCALRRPRLGALWLGAAFSGLARFALDLVRSGTPPLDPSASAWTGCQQSFLDVSGTGPYAQPSGSEGQITRPDAWRLLYLPSVVEDDLHYESPPFSPWEPVGTTTLETSAIRVRVHRHCPRHRLVYRCWSWLREYGLWTDDAGLESDSGLDERGYDARGFAGRDPEPLEPRNKIEIPVRPLIDQDASIAASCEVFGWVMRNCEGLPPESIFRDIWLQDEEEDDESESFHSADCSDPSDACCCNDDARKDTRVGQNVQDWLAEAE